MSDRAKALELLEPIALSPERLNELQGIVARNAQRGCGGDESMSSWQWTALRDCVRALGKFSEQRRVFYINDKKAG